MKQKLRKLTGRLLRWALADELQTAALRNAKYRTDIAALDSLYQNLQQKVRELGSAEAPPVDYNQVKLDYAQLCQQVDLEDLAQQLCVKDFAQEVSIQLDLEELATQLHETMSFSITTNN